MLFYKIRQQETTLSLEKFKRLVTVIEVTLPHFGQQELGPYRLVPISDTMLHFTISFNCSDNSYSHQILRKQSVRKWSVFMWLSTGSGDEM
jgi:hypothetical protein